VTSIAASRQLGIFVLEIVSTPAWLLIAGIRSQDALVILVPGTSLLFLALLGALAAARV